MGAATGNTSGGGPVYHVITPGDHFSPRTGSAIPTVVHGLASGAAAFGTSGRNCQFVVLQAGTYRPLYPSATPIEYDGPAPIGRRSRATDAVLGRLGLARRGAAAYFGPAVEALRGRPAGVVLAHNAPIVPWLLRDQPHAAVLYAHNDLLRTFTRAEAGRMLRHAAGVIAVSDALAEQLRGQLPTWLHDRVRVVRNGVDPDQFQPSGTPRQPGPLRVMFVGRTIPEKGADVLLKAAAMVDRDDVSFLVVGSHGFDPHAPLTAYEQQLRELAGQIRGAVSFEPFVDRDRLPELLRRADVLVVPSRWLEPLTLTVGEGLATGLPVLAARRGGIPEALGDAGILFDPDRPEELAQAITRLASSPSLREELSAKALTRARSHDWTWAWRNLRTQLDELDLTVTAVHRNGVAG